MEVCSKYRQSLCPTSNEGEFAAFIAYAQAFPSGFLALIDTYSTLGSGVYNFLAVALALSEVWPFPPPSPSSSPSPSPSPIIPTLIFNCRIYHNRLATLLLEFVWILVIWHILVVNVADFLMRYSSPSPSPSVNGAFLNTLASTIQVAAKFGVSLKHLKIFASNDINEDVLYSLYQQGHCIDAFGVGTHLVGDADGDEDGFPHERHSTSCIAACLGHMPEAGTGSTQSPSSQ